MNLNILLYQDTLISLGNCICYHLSDNATTHLFWCLPKRQSASRSYIFWSICWSKRFARIAKKHSTVYIKFTRKGSNENDGATLRQKGSEFPRSLVCLLLYREGSPLWTTGPGQQAAHSSLFHKLWEHLYASGLSDHHHSAQSPALLTLSSSTCLPKMTGQLLGSSCLYTRNQAKFSRSRRKYMLFSLTSLEQTCRQPQPICQDSRRTGYKQLNWLLALLRITWPEFSQIRQGQRFALILVLYLFNSHTGFSSWFT